MAPKEMEPASYESVYTEKELITIGDKLWLAIKLNGQRYGLPMVNVTPDNDVAAAIAWYNPKPSEDPKNPNVLFDASVTAMKGLLQQLDADVVATPASSKSEEFIQKATDELGIHLIKLLGGSYERMSEKDREDLVFEAASGTVRRYTPVTGTEKIMGLRLLDANFLRSALATHLKIVLGDDVISTKETIYAMQNTLSPIFGEGYNHTIAVLAVEALLTPSYPPLLESNTHALIAIPEILKLEKKKLFSIAKRAAIPQAILL